MKCRMLLLKLCLLLVFTAPSRAQPPRDENPQPTADRGAENRLNLNGNWMFAYGAWTSDIYRYGQPIQVPFTPETRLSGIFKPEFTRDHNNGIYEHKVTIPDGWDGKKRVKLHFGAVNYESTVFINGELIGTHRGGFNPFSFDITEAVQKAKSGVIRIRVAVQNPITDNTIIRGKFELREGEGSIFYKNSSFIRETVFLESVPETSIADFLNKPVVSDDLKNGMLSVDAKIDHPRPDAVFKVIVKRNGKIVGTSKVPANTSQVTAKVEVPNVELYHAKTQYRPDLKPNLYDLELVIEENGTVIDSIKSYTGFRKVQVANNGRVYHNGERFYPQFVLDQGYYNDESGYTPKSLDDIKARIRRSQERGIIGARYHQQTAPASKRWVSDTEGYVFWAEVPSARDLRDEGAIKQYIKEAIELMESVKNNPACVGITFFNENWGLDFMDPHQQSRTVIRVLGEVAHYFREVRPDWLFSMNDGRPISFLDQFGELVPEMKPFLDLRGRMIAGLHEYPWYAKDFEKYWAAFDRDRMVGGSRGFQVGPYTQYMAAPTEFDEHGNRRQIFGFDPEAPMSLSEYGGVSTYFKEGELPKYMMNYGPVERNPQDFANRVAAQQKVMGKLNIFTYGGTITQDGDTGTPDSKTGVETNGFDDAHGIPKYDSAYFAAHNHDACNAIYEMDKAYQKLLPPSTLNP